MKKILFYVIVHTLLITSAFAQQYQWAKTFDANGTLGNRWDPAHMAVDNSGNIFIASRSSNPVLSGAQIDVDPDPGITNTINSANGDNYFAKYDPAGNLLWVKQFPGAFMEIRQIKIASDGNVLLIGNIRSGFGMPNEIDMNPDPSVTNTLTTYGEDLFIAKYSGNTGDYIWARQIQSFNSEANDGRVEFSSYGVYSLYNTVDLDNQDNITICGTFYGYVDFELMDPEPDSVYEGGVYGTAFIVQYNPNGETNWLLWNGPGNEGYGFAVKSDQSGNIYYTGAYSLPLNLADNGIFLYKISEGDVSWSNIINTGNVFYSASAGSSEFASGLAIDNAGNVYMSGLFKSTVDFDPGPGVSTLEYISSLPIQCGFLAKYSSSGNYIWAKRIAGGSVNTPPGGISTPTITDENKLICTISITQDLNNPYGDIDPGSGVVDTFGSFIAICDTGANLNLFKRVKSTGYMVVKGQGIYLYGTYQDSVDFDLVTPNGQFYQEGLIPSVYFAKYNQCPDATYNTTASFCQGETYTFGSESISEPGTYYNTFSTANECDSIVVLTLSMTTVDTNVIQNGNTLSASANGDAYQWIDCSNNSNIENATSQNFTPSAPGNYKVEVTQNGCTAQSNCHEVNPVNINDITAFSTINIFPNPTQSDITIYSSQAINATLAITDITGRIIATYEPMAPWTTYAINISSLSNGLYFLKIKGEEHQQRTMKFVKQ